MRMTKSKASETIPTLKIYSFTPQEELTIQEAIGLVESRLRSTEVLSNPKAAKDLCQLHLAQERDEHFCCLFLDSQHRLIAFERMFRGTVDGAAVYPRVVVRRALELNAAVLVLAHNHPSGVPEASAADRRVTERLKSALGLIDVRILDHIIVGTDGTYSMAEAGLI
jgi:DNA repair protein RadC